MHSKALNTSSRDVAPLSPDQTKVLIISDIYDHAPGFSISRIFNSMHSRMLTLLTGSHMLLNEPSVKEIANTESQLTHC